MGVAETSMANPSESFPILPQDKEMFAALVASGVSYRDAAQRCGYSADYGWDLARSPIVRARILELAEEPAEAVRRSIRAEFQILRNRAALEGRDPEVRAEIDCRLRVLLAQAKVEGIIVDRKQVAQITARVSVPRRDLEAAIRADVERLMPGALKQLEAGVSSEDQIRAIAAGEVVVRPPV